MARRTRSPMTAEGGAALRDSLLSARDNWCMFDGIALRYDRMNRLLSLGLDRRWRRRAVAALNPQPGQRYLDVGSGTGDVAIEILRQAAGATVVGIDPAQQMLEIAQAKVQSAGLEGRIGFQAGDVTALPFDDGVFSGVISAFCIRNVSHRLRALAEMRRVLAPAGRVVTLELTVPVSRLVRLGHRLYTRWLVPLAGSLVARREAYRYLVDSIEDFPRPQDVQSTLEEAGFGSTTCVRLSGGIVSIFVSRA